MENKLAIFIAILFLNISNIICASAPQVRLSPGAFFASRENKGEGYKNIFFKKGLEQKRMKALEEKRITACAKHVNLAALKPTPIASENKFPQEHVTLSGRGAGWQSVKYRPKPKATSASHRK